MLRHARSLPTIRALAQNTGVTGSLNGSKAAVLSGTVSSRYNLVVPDIPHNEQRPYTEFRRGVHQTSKQNSLLTMNKQQKGEFSIMSLNTLKMECRKRGLKVSGRKGELVSRIQAFENSLTSIPAEGSVSMMSTIAKGNKRANIKKIEGKLGKNKKLEVREFSKSSKVEAKGDDSHIDYIKPIDPIAPSLVEDDYIVQIPSISTEASKKPVTKLEKELLFSEPENHNETIVSVAEGSDSKISKPSELDIYDDEFHHKGEGQEDEEWFKSEPYVYENGEIPGKDKQIWASILAVSGLWWFLKPKDKKKK